MFCNNCGAEIAETSKFCNKCGAPVATPTVAQPMPTVAQPIPTVTTGEPVVKHRRFCGIAIVMLVVLFAEILYASSGAPGTSRLYLSTYIFPILFAELVLSVVLFVRRRIPVAVGCFLLGSALGLWSVMAAVNYNHLSHFFLNQYFQYYLYYIVAAAAFMLLGIYALTCYGRKKTRWMVILFVLIALAYLVAFLNTFNLTALYRYVMMDGIDGFQKWCTVAFDHVNYPGLIRDLLLGISIIGIASWISNPYEERNDLAYNFNHVDCQRFSMGGHVVMLIFMMEIYFYVWICRATAATNGVKGRRDRTPFAQMLLRLIPFYRIIWYAVTASRLGKLSEAKGQRIGTAAVTVWGIFFPFIADILIQAKINHIAQMEMKA